MASTVTHTAHTATGDPMGGAAVTATPVNADGSETGGGASSTTADGLGAWSIGSLTGKYRFDETLGAYLNTLYGDAPGTGGPYDLDTILFTPTPDLYNAASNVRLPVLDGSPYQVLGIPGMSVIAAVETLSKSKDLIYYTPIYIAAPINFTDWAIDVVAPPANSHVHVGFYKTDATLKPGDLVWDSGAEALPGGLTRPTMDVTVQPGPYLVAVLFDKDQTGVDGFGAASAAIPTPITGPSDPIEFFQAAQAYGALPALGPGWTSIGAGGLDIGWLHLVSFIWTPL